MEELMEPGRFQIPIDGQDALPVAREYPRDIGERHCTANASLVRIERNDLPLAGLIHRAPPASWGSALLSRGRSTTGPAGGWAVASLRNLFSMIIVISGRSWPKSWRVGIPFAAIWQRRGTPASLRPRCCWRLACRSSRASFVPVSWLFQGTSTLTQGSSTRSRRLSCSWCLADRLTQGSTRHRLGGTGRSA